jgi:hypothetical protein
MIFNLTRLEMSKLSFNFAPKLQSTKKGALPAAQYAANQYIVVMF